MVVAASSLSRGVARKQGCPISASFKTKLKATSFRKPPQVPSGPTVLVFAFEFPRTLVYGQHPLLSLLLLPSSGSTLPLVMHHF